MKRSLAYTLALAVSFCLIALPSHAKDKIPKKQFTVPEVAVADCQDALADIVDLVNQLDVVKPQDTDKVLGKLLKSLHKVEKGLASGKKKDLQDASETVDNFWNDLVALEDKAKVDTAEADWIVFAAWDLEACIVELYYPDWNCLGCDDYLPFPDYPWF